VDGVALRADGALARVTVVRNPVDNGSTAIAAVFDVASQHGLTAPCGQTILTLMPCRPSTEPVSVSPVTTAATPSGVPV
jgi:hypothetical protein